MAKDGLSEFRMQKKQRKESININRFDLKK